MLRKEIEELKMALRAPSLNIKILKKVGNGSITKLEVESLSREFAMSINKVIKALGDAKSSIYYKAKAYPTKLGQF